MGAPPQDRPKVNVSIGTAAVLGLADTPMAAAPTTAYLMLGGRCLMNCAFCAQARESQAGALHLSRVTWPEYDLGTVVERLAGAVGRGTLRRVCLQVTVTADAFARSLELLRAVKATCDPSPAIVPELSTALSTPMSFSNTSLVTSTPIKPSRPKVSTACEPAAKLTLPRLATIMPSFLTDLPIKLTEPPVAALINP